MLENSYDIDDYLSFGERVRERRLALKYSQEKLGVLIGLDESCSRTRISRYETGVHEPNIQIAKLLAAALQVPLAYLYCEKTLIAKFLLALHDSSDEDIEQLLELVEKFHLTKDGLK
jgi:transcriptional regulator with XRE-family HTH domain